MRIERERKSIIFTQNNIQLIIENFQFVIFCRFQWLQQVMPTVLHVTFDFIKWSVDGFRCEIEREARSIKLILAMLLTSFLHTTVESDDFTVDHFEGMIQTTDR